MSCPLDRDQGHRRHVTTLPGLSSFIQHCTGTGNSGTCTLPGEHMQWRHALALTLDDLRAFISTRILDVKKHVVVISPRPARHVT